MSDAVPTAPESRLTAYGANILVYAAVQNPAVTRAEYVRRAEGEHRLPPETAT
jgi:hypothetical protein